MQEHPPPAEHRLSSDPVTSTETYIDRQYTPSTVGAPRRTQIGEHFIFTPQTENSFEFDDLFDSQYGTSADANASEPLTTNLATDNNARHFLHDPRHTSSPSIYSHSCPSFRSPTSVAEVSQAGAHLLEPRRDSTQPHPLSLRHSYNAPQPHTPVTGTQIMPMQPLPQASNYASQATPGSSHYAPFAGIFQDAGSASEYRKIATRFNRKPYRPPDDDRTIEALINSRQTQVKRIYDAMTRSDAAKDNSNSIAMRRWAHGAFYSSDLVEAFAHKVFDSLIEQAQHGFRGWAHNDYASDDRKGEPEDKDVSCEVRLENIIKGLEEEKTICEDVMASACQIRMFVNAPRAYARRKEANRHGNSKRGKAAPAKVDPARVTKSRRMSTRQATRSRQATPSLSSPPNIGQYPLPGNERNMQSPLPQAPYYVSARTHMSPSPGLIHLGLQQPQFVRSDNRPISAYPAPGYQAAAMPSPLAGANTPRFAAGSLQCHSPFTTPSIPIPTNSAQPTHDHGNQHGDVNDLFNCASWPGASTSADTFSDQSHAHDAFQPDNAAFDPNLLTFDFDPQLQHINDSTVGAASSFEGLPRDVSSMDPSHLHIDPQINDPSFSEWWERQQNVQPLPKSEE